MPVRSAINGLPEEIRKELDKRLIESSFSGYIELSEWLFSLGYNISKSSIHRHGQKFQEQLEAIKIATEQARAIAETVGDEEDVMGDALSRLTQEKLFNALVNLEDESALPKLSKAVADINRASVTVKKHLIETMRFKAKAAAEEASQIAKAGGLSDSAVEEIKARILGITT